MATCATCWHWQLNGGDEVLASRARVGAGAGRGRRGDRLRRQVAGALRRCQPDLPVHFDLAELRAYHYQTGVVFRGVRPGRRAGGRAWGRYDEIGEVFGAGASGDRFQRRPQDLDAPGSRTPQPLDGAVLAPPVMRRTFAEGRRVAGRWPRGDPRTARTGW